MKKSPVVKETKKNSTNGDGYARLKRNITEYDAIFSYRTLPASKAYIQAIADNLMAWADDENEEALRLDDFIDSRRLHWATFMQWIEKHDELKLAHAYAKRRIASRRERGAIKRKYDGSFIAKSLGYYAPEYREEAEFMAKLKATEGVQEGGAVFNITIPAAKDTGIKKAGGEEE